MTQKTNINTVEQQSLNEQLLVASPLSHDLKNAILIVSVVLNLVILIAWITLQVTSQYNMQLAGLLFS